MLPMSSFKNILQGIIYQEVITILWPCLVVTKAHLTYPNTSTPRVCKQHVLNINSLVNANHFLEINKCMHIGL